MKFKDLFLDNSRLNWGFIETIPEFKRLMDTPHSERWHKEGNPLNHTRLVCERMEKYCIDNNIQNNTESYLILMSAALCHDLGKAITTKWDDKKQDYACCNHGEAGAKIVRNLFFEEDVYLREQVCWLVRWHMTLHHVLEKENKIDRTLIKLSHNLNNRGVQFLWGLTLCDSLGSENEETDEFIINKFNQIKARIIKLNCFDKPYQFSTDYEKIKFFSDKNCLTIEDGKKENNDFTMYVMIGIPGAGKDTYIASNGLDKYEIISRDLIRSEIGLKGEKPQGNKKEEEKVTRIFNEKIFECCKNHKSFVLNNTNIRKKYRDQFTNMILPYRPKVVYIYIEPPSIDECKNRRRGQMPLDVIDKMWKDFDFPDLTECNMLLINKQ